MSTEPSPARATRRRPAALALLLTVVVALGAVSCSGPPTGDTDATVDARPVIYPLSLRYPGIRTVRDVAYGADRLQSLDVCLPSGVRSPTPTATAGSPTPEPDGTAAPPAAAPSEAAPPASASSGAAPSTSGAAEASPSGSGTATDADGTTGTPAHDAAADGDATGGSRPAVMMIHGGSWSHGDKATSAYHAVCQYLASQGFVTFDVDYRLAPTDPFPAGLDDVRAALAWVFRGSTLTTYDVDPDRVGVFGGSAGGNLASLLGVEDHETTDYAAGRRIRAVAELSGPSDLTAVSTGPDGVTEGFRRRQLLYLGCREYAQCPAARAASPQYQVTRATPPFFIGHSTHEFIPLWESTRFARALRRHHVPVTLVTVRGTAHSIAQLDEGMSHRVVAFFRARLR